jgi:hypothetical protein
VIALAALVSGCGRPVDAPPASSASVPSYSASSAPPAASPGSAPSTALAVSPAPTGSVAPSRPSTPAADPEPLLEAVRRALARLRPHGSRPGFADLSVDVPVSSLPRSLKFRMVDVEWHANRVGSRWRQAAELECHACCADGYDVSALDVFDRSVASFTVTAPLSRVEGTADTLCVAAEAALRKDPAWTVEPCSCGAPPLPSDLAAHALPTAPSPPGPPCDPAERSGLRFSRGPGDVGGTPSVRGTVAILGRAAELVLELRGLTRGRLLAALR